jgi:hypothetical protein
MHLLMMSLYALATSIVLAGIESKADQPKDRVKHGLKVFAAFMGIGLVLSWFLFPLPW